MGFFDDVTGGLSSLVTTPFKILGGIGNPNTAGIPGAPKNYFDAGVPQNQAVTDLQGTFNSFQKPSDITAYSAKDMSTQDLPEFDQDRNLTSQSLNSKSQSDSDALQRRFAAMGNLNSGAYIKASQQGDQAANENRANAMAGIGIQEAQTRRGLQQQEAQKEYQSGESTKQFNAGQANQFNQFKAENASKIASLDLGFRSAAQQAADDQYQAAMNGYQAKHTGGLLGSGGILGTGIGV